MSAHFHRVNAFFSLGIEPQESEEPDALTLRLRVQPVFAPQEPGLVSLSQVRQLGWPLSIRMEGPLEGPTDAPTGGTYHDEGYTDYGWTGGDEFETLITGRRRPIGGGLAVLTDFSAEEITIQARSQQLSVAGARLELAWASYALARLDQANGWSYHWRLTDPSIWAIELAPAGDDLAQANATFWAAIVVQDAPLTPPNRLTTLGPIYAIQSDRPDYLKHLNLTWRLTPAAALRADLQPLRGGSPARLGPIAELSTTGQTQWLRNGESVIVQGLTSATYGLAGARQETG